MPALLWPSAKARIPDTTAATQCSARPWPGWDRRGAAGAYAFSGSRPTFHRARRPVGEEPNQLLDTLSHRIVGVLERRGLLTADPDHCCLGLVPDSSLDHLRAASVSYRIAIGPHTGREALTLYSVPPTEENSDIPLMADSANNRFQDSAVT